MQKNGELVDFTAQLAQGLPEDLLRQARDFLRRERPDMDREAVEREAVASVRAWREQQRSEWEAAKASEANFQALIDRKEDGRLFLCDACFPEGADDLTLGYPADHYDCGACGREKSARHLMWRSKFKKPSRPVLRRGGGDMTVWLVFAAKRNGVMQ